MNDSRFTKAFSAMIALMVVLTVLLAITAVFVGGSIQDKLDAAQQAEIDKVVAERVKPVGQINVGEVPEQPQPAVAEAGGTPPSGEEVYRSTCAACHDPGIVGAPKTGDAEAWGARLDKGMQTLVDHAINGFQGETGIMPPKGGNTSLADAAVEAAVAYMVEAAGGDGGSTGAGAEAAAGGQAAAEPAAPEDPETTGQATAEAGAEATAEAAAEPAQETATAASDGPSAETLASGEKVYQGLCIACHAAGVAGAPKTGDSAAWAGRLDKGLEALVANAINGFQGDAGIMPPKGGNPALSDQEVEAAVLYMIEESR